MKARDFFVEVRFSNSRVRSRTRWQYRFISERFGDSAYAPPALPSRMTTLDAADCYEIGNKSQPHLYFHLFLCIIICTVTFSSDPVSSQY